MKIDIEYELGCIKTKDSVYVKKIDDIIDYIINIKAGREKLLQKKLTFNIINIEKVIEASK